MPPPPPDPIYILRGITEPIHSLLYHITPTEDLLYTGAENGLVHLWNLKTKRPFQSFQCSDTSILSIHSVGDMVLTQDKNYTLKLWQHENYDFKCVFEKAFDNPSFCKLEVFADTRERFYLAVPEPHSSIGIYTLRKTSIEIVNNLKANCSNLGNVSQTKIFRRNVTLHAIAIFENGTFILWQSLNCDPVTIYKLTADCPMSFDFDSDSLQGVCGTAENYLTFFRLDSDLQVVKCKKVEITNPGVGVLRIRPDRKIVVAGCWDGRLRIFSWKTCKLLAVLDEHSGPILDVRFSEEKVKCSKADYLLAAAASDKYVSLWKIYE